MTWCHHINVMCVSGFWLFLFLCEIIDLDSAAVVTDAEQHGISFCPYVAIADANHGQRNLIDFLKALLGDEADGMVPAY